MNRDDEQMRTQKAEVIGTSYVKGRTSYLRSLVTLCKDEETRTRPLVASCPGEQLQITLISGSVSCPVVAGFCARVPLKGEGRSSRDSRSRSRSTTHSDIIAYGKHLAVVLHSIVTGKVDQTRPDQLGELGRKAISFRQLHPIERPAAFLLHVIE